MQGKLVLTLFSDCKYSSFEIWLQIFVDICIVMQTASSTLSRFVAHFTNNHPNWVILCEESDVKYPTPTSTPNRPFQNFGLRESDSLT